MAPTKIKTEVGGLSENEVLVDTRSSLEYTSYHVPGSVHVNSEDFLIVKDPKNKIRKIDSDIDQIIERLAGRGVGPNVNVQLICDDKDLTECFKWQWLLKNLGIAQVNSTRLSDYIQKNRPLRNRPQPARTFVWLATNKEYILKNSDTCFVSYQVSCQ